MTYYDQIAQGYNELHQEEQEQKLKIVKQYIIPKPDDVLLDIGCGTGISTQFDCKCVGIDPSIELLKIAKQNYPAKTFVQAVAEKLPFPDNHFDIIISLTASQNFTNLEKAISEINRTAKQNCKIVVTILKKSEKVKQLEKLLNGYKRIIHEKDLIFIKK